MSQARIDALRKQLDGPRDGALLRFALASALREAGEINGAADAARRAIDFDEQYTAAYKLLGQALAEAGSSAAAMDAWQRGIAVAEQHGDVQAGKEMRVFLKRLRASQA